MMRQVSLALSLAGLSFMMTVIWGGTSSADSPSL